MADNDGKTTREGIERAAQDLRNATRGNMSHSEAAKRVQEAVRQGDRKRDNGNR